MTAPRTPAPTAASATEWSAQKSGGSWWVVNSSGGLICYVGHADDAYARGLAEDIAWATNAHGPLVEALERIAEQFCESDDCFASADARAALLLARGGLAAGE